MKYEFFTPLEKYHTPSLEQFEAANDEGAFQTLKDYFDLTVIKHEPPLLENPATLYGRSWFIFTGDEFIGYLYTTGREAK